MKLLTIQKPGCAPKSFAYNFANKEYIKNSILHYESQGYTASCIDTEDIPIDVISVTNRGYQIPVVSVNKDDLRDGACYAAYSDEHKAYMSREMIGEDTLMDANFSINSLQFMDRQHAEDFCRSYGKGKLSVRLMIRISKH